MAVVEKTAGQLVAGDVLLNNGAVIEQAVPCGKGTKVYLRAVFEDGYTQVVTIPVETPIATFVQFDH